MRKKDVNVHLENVGMAILVLSFQNVLMENNGMFLLTVVSVL